MTFGFLFHTVLFLSVGSLVIYQTLLHLLALRAKEKTLFDTAVKRRFAIIVPAHNEEKMISRTIYSIFGILYPKQLFDLIVVADNCTDTTASICRNLGAVVLERKDPRNRGKGYALRWAFDRLLASPKKYDAFVVIDADSLVSGNYLEVLNYYLEQGSDVIQSSDLVLPKKGHWGVETTWIGYVLYNYVKPLGRKQLGLGTGLRGNGMCFRSTILKEIPWKAWSRVEDLEYGLILKLHDVPIDFAPEATVWAEMPIQMNHAATQRTRWESGRAEVTRIYAPTFLREAIRNRSFRLFDTFLDLISPPIVPLMAFVLASVLFYFVFWFLNWLPLYHFILWSLLFLFGIANLFIGLFAGRADRDLYLATFRIPIYALWKIKLYGSLLIRGTDKTWIRTARDS